MGPATQPRLPLQEERAERCRPPPLPPLHWLLRSRHRKARGSSLALLLLLLLQCGCCPGCEGRPQLLVLHSAGPGRHLSGGETMSFSIFY